MKSLMRILMGFAFCCLAISVSADTFECGESMVETDVGTTMEMVQEKCGEPTTKTADSWSYANQEGQVTVTLYFVDGELQRIEEQEQE